MPYDGEFAHYGPLRRLAESKRVLDLLTSYHPHERTSMPPVDPAATVSDAAPSEWLPKMVLAVDGSNLEVLVKNGFPGAEASYVTVASVLLDVARMKELDKHRPADPREIRKTEQSEAIDCALPGCNVVFSGEDSAKASLRRALFEVFRSVQTAPDGETLLDTYEALLKLKPTDTREQRCPLDDCPSDRNVYHPREGQYSCACEHNRTLYSTDALRVHERMAPFGSNGAIFAEIRQVLERLWIIHILRTLEQKNLLGVTRRLAIVLDGPLAVFGQPAWLSKAIASELKRLAPIVRSATGGTDLLFLGIEKSGQAVDHFTALDQEDVFPKQRALLLSDAYIKQNIVFSTSTKPYGADTYFGRKLLYKTASGARIVANTPFLEDAHADTSCAEPEQFPRLPDAMSVLDSLVSSRYPHALAPLVAAHAEAAIPLNIGTKVLARLAKELMADGQS